VEEKIDASNSGISFGASGQVLLQSRGHFLGGGPREKQLGLFKSWTSCHRWELWAALGVRYVMYGEWVYAKHTIADFRIRGTGYTQLRDSVGLIRRVTKNRIRELSSLSLKPRRSTVHSPTAGVSPSPARALLRSSWTQLFEGAELRPSSRRRLPTPSLIRDAHAQIQA
jgi:hypothetical protein